MQTPTFRYLVLTVILLVGVGLYAASGEPLGEGAARWPTADAVYTVGPWSVEGEVVDANTNHAGLVTSLVTRVFRNPDGHVATLTLLSNQAPKLYGTGAEVAFLGAGYTIGPAPDDVAPVVGRGVSALVAQRGSEGWLVLYAYGERRGLLGNGPLAWGFALMDGMLAKPNDYYKLYLATRTDRLDQNSRRDAAELAGTLFPRIAAWYAA